MIYLIFPIVLKLFNFLRTMIEFLVSFSPINRDKIVLLYHLEYTIFHIIAQYCISARKKLESEK